MERKVSKSACVLSKQSHIMRHLIWVVSGISPLSPCLKGSNKRMRTAAQCDRNRSR